VHESDLQRIPAPESVEIAGDLRAEGLRKAYRGRSVVDGVALEIRRGEIVGLLGPNGAGKTTSFYLILGLVRADAGRIFLGQEEITDQPMYLRARRGISYLPQESSIFRRLTVEQNLLAILETRGLPREEMRKKAARLLEEFGLSRVASSPAWSLSGGERRRAEIARALCTDPAFMLLDEPFAGIDPIAVADIQRLIGELSSRRLGVLITDHNVRETLQITDRAYIINAGRIFRQGTPVELASDPDVRRIYLGENFRLD